MIQRTKKLINSILSSGTGQRQLPKINKNNESSIPGLYIIGDLAGAPVIKLAMEQGVRVVEHISSLSDAKSGAADVYDIIVVGAGAAGLNAALACGDSGLSCIVLEKNKIANTIEDFPEGKWIYAEPDETPPKGKLWLDGAAKEDLINRWHQIIDENGLEVHIEEPLEALDRKDGVFTLKTNKTAYKTKRMILATGARSAARKLEVPGEDRERVYHKLYSPKQYQGENIIVVGGGNTAIEAAITLCKNNQVSLSYRNEEITRVFKDNKSILDEKVSEGKIDLILSSNITEFGDDKVSLSVNVDGGEQTKEMPYDHAFVLIGFDIPTAFLKSLGIKLENEWEGSFFRSTILSLAVLIGLWIFGGKGVLLGHDMSAIPGWVGILVSSASVASLIRFGVRGDRYAWLGFSFLIWYTIYGAKVGMGNEFWPFKDWGYQFLSFQDRPWAFWYTVLYTGIMTIFGIQALKRWGLDRKDKFQIWRFISLLGFQWVFFFIIPEFLFQWAVEYQWVGERLASDPTFADQAWRSYGLIYAWPLFFYTFFYDPHTIWIVWGVVLTFVLIPVLVIWHGKRYCSWICGCGGLAETFGDRWRHLAPKGKTSIKWERMNTAVLIFAALATGFMLLKDGIALLNNPAEWSVNVYRVFIDVWLVGILPVTLYPFLGGKVWCRYWCPLAKMMQLQSSLFTKLGFGKFKIESNSKCISCNECTTNCQVGIDVMDFALKQETIDNTNSTCIGCGICVTVCPMDVLSFGKKKVEFKKKIDVIAVQ